MVLKICVKILLRCEVNCAAASLSVMAVESFTMRHCKRLQIRRHTRRQCPRTARCAREDDRVLEADAENEIRLKGRLSTRVLGHFCPKRRFSIALSQNIFLPHTVGVRLNATTPDRNSNRVTAIFPASIQHSAPTVPPSTPSAPRRQSTPPKAPFFSSRCRSMFLQPVA